MLEIIVILLLKFVWREKSMLAFDISKLRNFENTSELPEVVSLLEKHQKDIAGIEKIINTIKSIEANQIVSGLLNKLIDNRGGRLMFDLDQASSKENISEICNQVLLNFHSSYWAELNKIIAINQIFPEKIHREFAKFACQNGREPGYFESEWGYFECDFNEAQINQYIHYINECLSPKALKESYLKNKDLISITLLNNGNYEISFQVNFRNLLNSSFFAQWACTLIKQYHPNNWVSLLYGRSFNIHGITSIEGIAYGELVLDDDKNKFWISLEPQYFEVLKNILGLNQS